MRHMASKPKLSIDKAAAMVPTVKPRRRPPSNGFKKGHKFGFPKGQSGNPGGKPKALQKFSAKVAEEMMQPCPKEIKQALGLKRGALVYDAMVKALLVRAASGDTAAFTTARETVEGRLVQRNVNVSASLAALQDDPEFVKWLDATHAEYMTFKGEPIDQRPTIEATPLSLRAAENEGSGEGD
jgi:hypothetical protein